MDLRSRRMIILLAASGYCSKWLSIRFRFPSGRCSPGLLVSERFGLSPEDRDEVMSLEARPKQRSAIKLASNRRPGFLESFKRLN